MVTDPFKDTVKGEHVVVSDPGIIPLDGREEMKIRAITQFLNDSDGWETLVCDNDAALDVIIQDK